MKRTVLRMLDEAARDWPNDPYALKKTDEGYIPTTFAQAKKMAGLFAAWLLSSGFKGGDNFAILGEGSPEWVCGELGILSAGLVSVPLSIRLLNDELLFRIEHSEAKGILTTHNQLEKLLQVIALRMGKALTIVYLDNDAEWGRSTAEKYGFAPDGFRTYQEVLAAGSRALDDPESGIADRLEKIKAETEEDAVATISYTSGTMGNPKGIMLTHLNYWSNCHDSNILFDNPLYFRSLLILPADHSFTHTVAIYTALTCGVALYFADSRGGNMAMLRNILLNIHESNPMFLFTVPALSGNFMKKIIAGVEEKGILVEKIFRAGIAAGMKWNGNGFDTPSIGVRASAFLPYFLAKAFVFGKVRKRAFGDSIRFCVSGGSMLDVKQQKFFAALGVPVYQGYGLTEAAPVISSNIPRRHKFGTAGVIAPSVECAIMDDNGLEVPRGQLGEITIVGENVMKGYYKNPGETACVVREGRLWTGDLGYFDEDGFLVVVGRKRALLIAEDGEKYSPEEIEEAVTMSTDVIDQIMVWCIYKKYPCALVTLDIAKVEKLIKVRNIKSHELLCKILQNEFYRFKNDQSGKTVRKAWVPAAFQIVPEPFGENDGTINSTLKLVRHKVETVHKALIDYSYTREGSSTVNPKNIRTLQSLFIL